ncbi:MAG: DUF2249 domain-containing protein [Acidimicrobiales bacterium]
MNDLTATKAMTTHHAQLVRRVDALARSVESDPTVETAAALLAYVADEVLPHALAEEASVYRAAAELPELAPLIGDLIIEHHELARLGDDLGPATPLDVRRAAARRVRRLFADHVRAENDVVLPALRDGAPGSLPELLDVMHERLSTPEVPPADVGTDDALVDLLGQASDELVRAGAPDTASRLLARAWTLLRAPRPDLARRVTSRLHRLARSLEPTAVSIAAPSASAPSDRHADVLDVRSLTPRDRHESIFSTYLALRVGDAFILVNDHDPQPLRYQFDAEHPGAFTWDYLESGPRVWRVRIARTAA